MLFDDQAATFDTRAGIPPDAVGAVARAAGALGGAAPGRRWLEVGAGTGLLSLPLLGTGIDYTGFDRSEAMLDAFRARLAEAGLAAGLCVADGNARWPAEDGGADVVFSARAIHHLRAEHAAAEVRRVLAPGGVLLLGRVARPPDSPKAEMRRTMRQVLREHGHGGRSGERAAEALAAALGGWSSRTVEAARWTHTHRPADSIASWAAKEGLAGAEVDRATRAAVLEEVRRRAEARFGDLARPLPQEEWFELRAFSAVTR